MTTFWICEPVIIRGRAQWTRWCICGEIVRDVTRARVLHGLINIKKDFEKNALANWQPVQHIQKGEMNVCGDQLQTRDELHYSVDAAT